MALESIFVLKTWKGTQGGSKVLKSNDYRILRRLDHFLDRLERLWVWIPVLWRLEDYDYGYTLDVLSLRLKAQARHIARHRVFKDWHKTVRQIRAVYQAIDRLRLDEYDSVELKRGRGFCARAAVKRNRDWAYAFDTMRDHMREWWD